MISEQPRAHGGPRSHNLGVESHLAWRFGEMNVQVNALARDLVGLGVRKGDRVGVIMGNNSAYAMLKWACASIGAILVSTLSQVGVSHLFVVSRIRTSAYVSMFTDAFPSLSYSSPGSIEEPSLPQLRHLCTVDFREVLVWGEHASEERDVQSMQATLQKDEVINLQFTNGTTGSPKAVSLTHHNLLNNGVQIGRCMRLTDLDILCNVPPLFHSWTHGSSIVYPSDISDPPKIVDAVVNEKCTALHGVPTHFLGALDFSRLRTNIVAGSSIPTALMKRLIEKLNLTELTIAYGMSMSLVSPCVGVVETNTQQLDSGDKVCTTILCWLLQLLIETLRSAYNLQKGYWADEEHEGYLKICRTDEGLSQHHISAWIVKDPVKGLNVSRQDVRKVNASKWVWFVGEDGYDELLKKGASTPFEEVE
ncbi:hypothetical protein BC835DRAFT_1407357 [Cytidiella melzeri]|nr:hypothetical protein BC835DRAFT_1407357 [Cytidiella melzeri]